MKRTMERELAFKAIYAKLFNVEEQIEETSEFILKIINIFDSNKDEIQNTISSNLKGYTLSRLFKIDLAIITLAIIELNYIKENAKEIIINEAVELAKKYSTEKSPKFINGFLAGIVK